MPWATFLRNHDELTLEMVTDEDRDTMYRGYAAERAARINLGIRRRLAPLLGVRRKIELMNALLLSLPGTPVLYYGDEIGMGDNIYLGDRDGVRTPMQWSSDRNGGFSRANPQKLYLRRSSIPSITTKRQRRSAAEQYGIAVVVDEAAASERKEHRLFGRGSIEFMTVTTRACCHSCANSKASAFSSSRTCRASCSVLASISSNSRAPFPRGVRSHELPEIGDAPYFVSLGPHDFYWLALTKPQPVETAAERPALIAKESWTELLAPARRKELARVLLSFALQRRWVPRQGEDTQACGAQRRADVRPELALCDRSLAHRIRSWPRRDVRDSDRVCRGRRTGGVHSWCSAGHRARRAEQRVRTRRGGGVLYDALCADAFNAALLAQMTSGTKAKDTPGALGGNAFALFAPWTRRCR